MGEVLVPKIDPANPPEKGPGWFTLSDANDGRKYVYLRCGNGHNAWLSTEPDRHRIAGDGRVTPSVACPVDGCDWHVMVRLAGW